MHQADGAAAMLEVLIKHLNTPEQTPGSTQQP
jgi:hypothetical protein